MNIYEHEQNDEAWTAWTAWIWKTLENIGKPWSNMVNPALPGAWCPADPCTWWCKALQQDGAATKTQVPMPRSEGFARVLADDMLMISIAPLLIIAHH